MAKKKKKKGEKTPYVHIDLEHPQEQFPDARSQAGVIGGPQAQGPMANGNRGSQRMADPRNAASGANGSSAGDNGASPNAPFVIPVFKKPVPPQAMQGMQPAQSGFYGTGQFPAVSGSVPNGNPRQNLAQIQQNLLNHHSAAQQQAHQNPMQQPMGQPIQQGFGTMGQQQSPQVAQQVAAEAAAKSQAAQQAAQQAAAEAAAKSQAAQQAAAEAAAKSQAAQQAAAQQKAAQQAAAQQAAAQQQAAMQHAAAAQRQVAQQATVAQGTGQFVPVQNQATVQQSARQTGAQQSRQAMPGQPHQQAHAGSSQSNAGQPLGPTSASRRDGLQNTQGIQFSAGMAQRHQGVQPQGAFSSQQGSMQPVAGGIAAGAVQPAVANTQTPMQSTAQPRTASQQPMRSNVGQHSVGGMGAQKVAGASQASAYQPRQTTGTQSAAQSPSSQIGHTTATAAPVASRPVTSYQETKAQDTPTSTLSAAGSISSTHQPPSTEGVPSSDEGAALIDPEAIEDSTIFDEPTVSLEEGMRKSVSGRKLRRRVIVIVAVVVVLLGGGIAAYTLLSEQGVVPRISIETATVPVSPQGSSGSSSSSSASSSASDAIAPPDATMGGDLSGAVVYQYTANTASGVEYQVEETVTFQANGDCQSSTMSMTFPDEASAKTFTDNLARDYGTSFKLDSLNGNTAVVTIDNSGLHLTRDEYENALRYSVSDLVVTK